MKYFLLIFIGIIIGLVSGSITYAILITDFKKSVKEKKAYILVEARDYQIELVEDSVFLYDGNRLVGTVPLWEQPDSSVQYLITEDNR